MKKLFCNTFFKTYLILLINMVFIEVIFKLVSSSNIFTFSTLRIFIGINILSLILSFLLDFGNNITRKIGTSFIVLVTSIYSCLQAGFYNFLGVYMSFQTSSQLGAVLDYIREFLLSFQWFYFLTLLPFVLLIIYYLFFDHLDIKKTNHWISSFISIGMSAILSVMYYVSITLGIFQNNFQTIDNKELFITASNPSISIQEFGTIGYALIDFRAMIFPVTIEENYEEIGNNKDTPLNEDSRVIDDQAWEELIKNENDDVLNSLNKYFINRGITEKNEYTGMFENKNLIVIMMESVNDIFLNPQYFPNFNKLVNEGWYWENNYSPRNSCATMNNEFSGLTSLYSIYNTCTASKYKKNTYYESMFNLFNNHNYTTFSAHNYTEAYYPRKTIHRNMGSMQYYGVDKLGIKYSNEYRNWSNDDEFMEAILKILDDKNLTNKNFMTWLTTVSSHQPYSVSSTQGDMYYDMTSGTNYPTDVRRYMSKLKILDDGLGILLNGLESRGILDDTVIVLYGDHYPYGISTNNLNKVLDYDTSEYLNAERVPFVIYNSQMTSRVFSDYTFYINILPTLANLFNLQYDPRLYLGQDLLDDDYQSLVVFADGSWKNEKAFYNAAKSKITYFSSDEYSPEEIKKINEDINQKINISTRVIKNNYFSYLGKNLTNIEEDIANQAKTMCLFSDEDKEHIYN